MFETERLVVRAAQEDVDLVPLWKALNDVEYRTMLGNGSLVSSTKEDVKKLWFTERPTTTLPSMSFCLKPDPNDAASSEETMGELPAIGSILFFHPQFDAKNRTALVGLGIFDPSNRGKGYGREVLTWMLEYGFMELNLHRIELQVYSFNKSAATLYRSVGFVDEGVARKTYFKTGKWHDTIKMAVLEEEWWELRKKNNIRVLPPHLQ